MVRLGHNQMDHKHGWDTNGEKPSVSQSERNSLAKMGIVLTVTESPLSPETEWPVVLWYLNK